MIPREAKLTYSCIHAPEALKERVLNQTAAKKNRQNAWRNTLVAAACFALVCISAFQFFYAPAPSVNFNGEKILTAPTTVYEQGAKISRSIAPNTVLEIPLTISGSKNISVSHGTLLETEENIIWKVSAEEIPESGAVLTLERKNTTVQYLLYTNHADTWYLKKEET